MDNKQQEFRPEDKVNEYVICYRIDETTNEETLIRFEDMRKGDLVRVVYPEIDNIIKSREEIRRVVNNPIQTLTGVDNKWTWAVEVEGTLKLELSCSELNKVYQWLKT